MDVAVAGMPVHDALHVVLLEDPRERVHVRGQHLGVYRAVFDELGDALRSGELLQEGDGRLAHGPQVLLLGRVEGPLDLEGGASAEEPLGRGQPLVELGVVAGLELDQQGGIGALREHGVQPRVVFAHEGEEVRVHDLERRGLEFQQGEDGFASREDRGEVGHGDGPPPGERHEVERRLGDQAQRPFGADEDLVQVDVAVAQHPLDPVARAVLHDPGQRGGDGIGAVSQAGQHAPVCAGRHGVAGHERRQLGSVGANGARAEHLAAVQHHLECEGVILRPAVGDRAPARGVVRDHAAQAAVVLAGGVGGEEGAERLDALVEHAHDHPRLHPGPRTVGGHLEDPVHVAGEVDLYAGAHGRAGEAGPRTPRHERDAVLAGVGHQPAHVLGVAGGHDPQWLDLVDAAVGGVEVPRQVVELYVAADHAAQIALDGGDGGSHRWPRCRVRQCRGGPGLRRARPNLHTTPAARSGGRKARRGARGSGLGRPWARPPGGQGRTRRVGGRTQDLRGPLRPRAAIPDCERW